MRRTAFISKCCVPLDRISYSHKIFFNFQLGLQLGAFKIGIPERHKGSICLPYGSYTEPPCSTLHLKIFRKPYYHGTLTEPKLRKSSVGRAFINTKWKSFERFWWRMEDPFVVVKRRFNGSIFQRIFGTIFHVFFYVSQFLYQDL